MAQGKVQIQKSSISNVLIFQIWIDINLEHLVRDYKDFLLPEIIKGDIRFSTWKACRKIFAYFEEKSLNTSDQYLYDTYGQDLIKEVADRLIQELTPKTNEPSTKN